MAARVKQTKGEHKRIMEALEARDSVKTEKIMRTHITKPRDQIVQAVKEGYSNIYMPGEDAPFEQELENTNE